ncbi:unnamed protein product [Adineta ricciae]|uniref:Uncharacterized protein n=1 Tax=Adineta ricciae TaxID=249248 RepID=A0A815QUC4_ADIRI|nr:unnamed protein product [Adineta ricciae]CAF1606842.1 unnamed protein product [Adineta ricciae]
MDVRMQNHICVQYSRCCSNPICYALSMISENLYPPLTIVANETAAIISTDTITIQLRKTTTPKAKDKYRFLYVSRDVKNEVRRWKIGEEQFDKEGTLVAGGNGKGKNLNQLNWPRGGLMDDLGRVYVADG